MGDRLGTELQMARRQVREGEQSLMVFPAEENGMPEHLKNKLCLIHNR
jgi:hypothetical protein